MSENLEEIKASVSSMSLKPGDVVVINFDRRDSPQVCQQMTVSLRKALPKGTFLLALYEGAKIEVIPKENARALIFTTNLSRHSTESKKSMCESIEKTTELPVIVVDEGDKIEVIPNVDLKAAIFTTDLLMFQDEKSKNNIRRRIEKEVGLPVVLLDKGETIEALDKDHLHKLLEEKISDASD